MATALDYVGHFYDKIESGMAIYLQLLVCFSIPWVVIVVYGHLRRRGYYDIDDLQVFNRGEKDGIYWYRHGLNPSTLGSLGPLGGRWHDVLAQRRFHRRAGAADGRRRRRLVASGLVALIGCPIIDRLWPDRSEVYGPAKLQRAEAVPSTETQAVR